MNAYNWKPMICFLKVFTFINCSNTSFYIRSYMSCMKRKEICVFNIFNFLPIEQINFNVMPAIMKSVVSKWVEQISVQLTIILLRFILFYFPIIPLCYPVLSTFFDDIDALEVPINIYCIKMISMKATKQMKT